MNPRAVLVVALIAIAGRAAAAPPEPPPTSVAVDVAAETGAAAGWYAAALEGLVARELARFGRVALAEKRDTSAACPGRDARCVVEAYRAAGAAVVVLGTVRRGVLAYEVYATWARGRAFDGALAVSGVETAALTRRIGQIVRPIVARGGLIDQRPATATSAAESPPGASAAKTAPPASAGRSAKVANAAATAPSGAPKLPSVTPPSTAPRHPVRVAAIFAALLLFVALPPALLALLVGRADRKRRGRPASWKWSLALIAACGALFALVATVDLRPLFARDLVTAVAAGMLWGAFVLVNAAWVFSPLHGLGQARHDMLWPLLKSWLLLALLRASLLLFYLPVLLLALWVGRGLDLPERVTVGLALPAFGLFVYVWLLTLVDNLAVYLDAQLVTGPPTARNPWHATVRRYFRGYIRRNGVDVDQALFERTLFLPSLVPGVVSYGGGLARPRILIGEQAREAALGQLPDETELPERTVNPEELPFGFLLPSTAAARPPSLREAVIHGKSAEERRRELTHAPARPRGAMPRLVGENTTLLGWVMPQPLDEGLPLISNTQEDYDVVKRLLTEHYAAFEKNMDDDEVDDTDPTQKDFLFGALLREMGQLASHDTFLSTLRLSIAVAEPRAPGFLRGLLVAPIRFYERFLSGPAARVADAHAALNQGLHHLIQYLMFLRGEPAAVMTARANAPRLIQTSKDMLERMDRAAIPTADRQSLRATPRNRLLWMSDFLSAELGRRRDRTVAIVATLAVLLVAGTGIFFAVRDAIDYHPTYVERTKTQARVP